MSGSVITGLDNLFLRQDVLQSLTGDQKMLALYDAGLDIKGGVRLDGAGSDTPGNGVFMDIPVGREFELTFKCRQTGFGAWRPVGSVMGGPNEFALNVGYPWQADGVAPSFGDTPPVISSLHHGKWIDVAYGYDGTQWYLKLNGVRYNTSGEIPSDRKPSSVRRLLGGVIGGYGQIAGDIAEIKLINKIDATPADLVHRGFSLRTPSWDDGYGPIAGCTPTSFTRQHNAGESISIQPHGTYALIRGFRPGQKLRLTCNATINSGTAGGLPGWGVWNGSWFVNMHDPLTPGFNDITITLPDGYPYLAIAFWNHSGVGWPNATESCNYTISDITVDAIGTVAHYTPDSVGHDKTWSDMVNGQDMILADSPRQFNVAPRRPNCVVRKWDVNLHNVTIDGFGGEAWVGCDIRNTLKPRLNTSSILTATSSSLPDGLTILDAKSDAGGAVTIRVMNNTGAAINTHISGVPVVTLHHYIP